MDMPRARWRVESIGFRFGGGAISRRWSEQLATLCRCPTCCYLGGWARRGHRRCREPMFQPRQYFGVANTPTRSRCGQRNGRPGEQKLSGYGGGQGRQQDQCRQCRKAGERIGSACQDQGTLRSSCRVDKLAEWTWRVLPGSFACVWPRRVGSMGCSVTSDWRV